jgi:membrane protein
LRRAYRLARDTLQGFVDDDALTRAAAIAYFTLFSIGPLIFLASGIASFIFGEAEVQAALASQLRGLLGREAASTVQGMAEAALGQVRGGWALAIGLATLVITASGAFAALQGALNAIWKTEAPILTTHGSVIAAFLRARALSIGLVGTTAFLLLASLIASAAITALGEWLTAGRETAGWMLSLANFSLSFALIACLFAAVFKILPDRRLEWRDVIVGAIATAFLFTLGKGAIGLYIGRAEVSEGFGAAGSLAVVLLWLYYSAAIFLLGAEFTRAWSGKEPTTPVLVTDIPHTREGLVRLDGGLGGGKKDSAGSRLQRSGLMLPVALFAFGLALRLARR